MKYIITTEKTAKQFSLKLSFAFLEFMPILRRCFRLVLCSILMTSSITIWALYFWWRRNGFRRFKSGQCFCVDVVADVCWSFHKPGCEKMNFPQSSNEARATFLVNLAGVYSLRSEFDKARKCLQQVRTRSFTILNTWKFFRNGYRRIFADYILSNYIHLALLTLCNLQWATWRSLIL